MGLKPYLLACLLARLMRAGKVLAKVPSKSKIMFMVEGRGWE